MMDFIMTTLSFIVALVLVQVAGFVIFTRPAVIKWYTKKCLKMSEDMMNDFEDDL